MFAEQLGLASPENYAYLSQSGTYTVEGTNDVQEFQETMKGFTQKKFNDEVDIDEEKFKLNINFLFVSN
jgi:myosin-1